MRSRQLWSKDKLVVNVVETPSGLEFRGQDFNPHPFGDSDYEYVVAVDSIDVPLIVRALQGTADDDVLDLIERFAEVIMMVGEKTWLTSIGAQPRLFTNA